MTTRQKNPDSRLLGDVDELDLVRGAQSVVGLVPGAKGTVLGGALHVADGVMSSDREKEYLRKEGIDLERAQTYSVAARKKLERLDGQATNNLIKFGVYALGSLLGGMLFMTLLLPLVKILPLGSVIIGGAGALAGGWLAGYLYEGATEKTEQDVVARAAQDFGRQKNHQAIDRVQAFATLMASLPPRVQAAYERRLYERVGTDDFAQAAQAPEGQRALLAMMHDPGLEQTLRGYTHIPVAAGNPDQHVADQYAELVNSGVLDARAIVLYPEKIRNIASRYYMENAVRERAAVTGGSAGVLPPRQIPMGADRARQQDMEASSSRGY